MDRETDKKLDDLTAKLLKNFSRETPSLDFTTQVMSRVESLSKSGVTQYKPLISNKMWVALAILVACIFSYLIFGNVQLEEPETTHKMLDLLPQMNSFTLPDYQISKVLLYGVLGFTFFMGIQIFMLKNHFNKRFA